MTPSNARLQILCSFDILSAKLTRTTTSWILNCMRRFGMFSRQITTIYIFREQLLFILVIFIHHLLAVMTMFALFLPRKIFGHHLSICFCHHLFISHYHHYHYLLFAYFWNFDIPVLAFSFRFCSLVMQMEDIWMMVCC